MLLVAFLSDPWGVATYISIVQAISVSVGLHFYLTRGELQRTKKFFILAPPKSVAFLSDPWGVATKTGRRGPEKDHNPSCIFI